MLQNKDIANIQEVKTFFKDSWVQPDFFATHLKLFKFKKASSFFSSVKTSGVSYLDLLNTLLLLPFAGIKNVYGLHNNSFPPKTSGEKDVYYRALENQKVDWRKLLSLFIDRYLQLDHQHLT
jgi:hypothetical protein